MISGGLPMVSNGAPTRFTQAVRSPAAPALTMSKALPETSRSWRAGRPRRCAAYRYTPADGL